MNASATAMLGALGIREGDSLLDMLADDGPARDLIANWPEVASHMVARLRTESVHLGGDPVLDAAVARLVAALGTDRAEHYSEMPAVVTADYRSGGMTLSFFSTISQFGSAEDIALADVKIELMFPADAQTRDVLFAQFG